jgi:hypothetical protein
MIDKERKNLIIKMAELGVLRSLPDMLDKNLKPGRLRSRYVEVSLIVDEQLKGIYEFYNYSSAFFKDNRELIAEYLNMLGDITGWKQKPTDIAEVVAFCVAMVERAPKNRYPDALLKNLTEVLEYYERGDGVSYANLYNGDKFESKWNRLKELEEW